MLLHRFSRLDILVYFLKLSTLNCRFWESLGAKRFTALIKMVFARTAPLDRNALMSRVFEAFFEGY